MDDSYFALHTVHNGYELEKVFGIRPHMLSSCFDEAVWNAVLEGRKQGKSVPQIFCENQIEIQMITEAGNYSDFNPFEGEIFRIPNKGIIRRYWMYPEIFIIMVTGSIKAGLSNIRMYFSGNLHFRRSQMRKTAVI